MDLDFKSELLFISKHINTCSYKSMTESKWSITAMVINTLNFFYNGISYNDGSALDSLVASSSVWIHKVCVLLEPSLK